MCRVSGDAGRSGYGAAFRGAFLDVLGAKRPLLALVRVLTQQVPYEDATHLKEHIAALSTGKTTIQAVNEYKTLARTRLSDLEPAVDATAAIEGGSDVEARVREYVRDFSSSGTVPRKLTHDQIFRKKWFLLTALPALLTPLPLTPQSAPTPTLEAHPQRALLEALLAQRGRGSVPPDALTLFDEAYAAQATPAQVMATADGDGVECSAAHRLVQLRQECARLAAASKLHGSGALTSARRMTLHGAVQVVGVAMRMAKVDGALAQCVLDTFIALCCALTLTEGTVVDCGADKDEEALTLLAACRHACLPAIVVVRTRIAELLCTQGLELGERHRRGQSSSVVVSC